MVSVPSWGRRVQDRIYRDGITGRTPQVSTSAAGLEEQARRHMSRRAWAYIAGGAGSEATMRANRDAFDRWQLVPRVLRDVSARDLTTELFGTTLPRRCCSARSASCRSRTARPTSPVAHAAAERGVPFIFSNQASVAMERTAAAMGDAPRWFQMYWSTEDELVDSFLARAAAVDAGAVVVTLDTTMLGWRPRDLDLGSLPFARGEGIAQYTSDPVFRRLLESVDTAASPRPRVTPSTIRHCSSSPLITRADSARTCSRRCRGRRSRRSCGSTRVPHSPSMTSQRCAPAPSCPWCSRVCCIPMTRGAPSMSASRASVVSTHGGRQVDGSISALAALPGIVAAVDGRVPVLLDSGVRTGSDIAKALALGATAVLIGRPYAYGLAVAGEAGVGAVIDHLLAELDLTLGLCGVTTPAELTREHLH